ncbi:MAG: ADP-ribosylglycohydrolase family protein [Bacteroidota bacterium]
MLGAIAGDISGSVYEFRNYKGNSFKDLDFELFAENARLTDDTAMTLATMDCLLHGKPYADTYRSYGRRFAEAGYGGMFREWLASDDMGSYNSFGNGSAMRVGPVGWAMGAIEDVLNEARRSAEVTHSHPEGIKGAQAIAASVYWARKGKSKAEIRAYIVDTFGYDLDRTVERIRPGYRFDVTCQGSVPEAIIAFLDSESVESAIRLGISLGGDADTIACMAGGIAEAFYQDVSGKIVEKVRTTLPEDAWALLEKFYVHYGIETAPLG